MNKKLRVCMLIYHYWPGPEGGTERQCRKLVTALACRGVDCVVLTSRSLRSATWRERDHGATIIRLPILDGFRKGEKPKSNLASGSRPERRPLRSLLISARLSRLLGEAMESLNAMIFLAGATITLSRCSKSFDVIHVHTSEWIAGFAVWLGRRLRIPVLCKLATLPALPEIKRSVPFRTVWDRLRRRASTFIALNGEMAAELRSHGVPNHRILIIPNSTELPDISTRREQEGMALFVGNLTQHAWKALDVLFDGWTRVSREMPSVRLVVLGGGDCRLWERYLHDRGTRQSVSFHGFVQDVDTFYQRAALLVLPSRQEGMSNALLESQSWGIPAVVSDIAGNRAIVDHGHNGIVVPVDDSKALADGIIQLLRDGKTRLSMGQAARRRVAERFTLDAVTERTLAAYGNLIPPSRPRKALSP